MTVLLTLTTAGADTGPFNLFSNLDEYTSAFETGVLKVDLESGYLSYLVPDGTTTIRVMSDGACLNYVDLQINLTTTTTTTIANPETSILSFESYEKGMFTFTLSNVIYSRDVVITYASVEGSTTETDCTDLTLVDGFAPGALTIHAGTSSGSVMGLTPFECNVLSAMKGSGINIDGFGTFYHGQTLIIDGTVVTVDISNCCMSPYVCSLYSEYSTKYCTYGELDPVCDVCAASNLTVYTTFPETIATGTTVYTDSALTTPLIGYKLIMNPTTFEVFNLNVSTGKVNASTIGFC